MHLVKIHFFKAYMSKMTLKSNWVLHLFHVHYYSRARKSNISAVLKGSRLWNTAFFPQQMLTSALFDESLISNYTVKNYIVRFWISTPEMCSKVWHWSRRTYLKQPLHKKKATLKTGMKLNMQIELRTKQHLVEITWYEFLRLRGQMQVWGHPRHSFGFATFEK